MEKNTRQTQEYRQVLNELVLGMVLWSVVICLLTVWLVNFELIFAVSITVGTVGAAAMVIHMYYAIRYAIEMPEDLAGKYLRKQSALRMGAATVLILLAYWLKGNLVAVFLGLLTLKLGVYTQPLLHKFMKRRRESGKHWFKPEPFAGSRK